MTATTPPPPPAVPPPPPTGGPQPEVQQPTSRWSARRIAVISALIVFLVLLTLWLTARNSANNAAIDRDAAISERDAATRLNLALDGQLLAAEIELADARAALDESPDGSVEPDGLASQEVEQLQQQAAELAAEVERLEAELDRTAAGSPAPSTEGAAPDSAAAVSILPDDIGDQISGLFRDSVLGGVQKSCLGQTVLDELGAQRVVNAIAAESPGDDAEFVEALRDAADSCGIDPSAVFG